MSGECPARGVDACNFFTISPEFSDARPGTGAVPAGGQTTTTMVSAATIDELRHTAAHVLAYACLLYTSDAADE